MKAAGHHKQGWRLRAAWTSDGGLITLPISPPFFERSSTGPVLRVSCGYPQQLRVNGNAGIVLMMVTTVTLRV